MELRDCPFCGCKAIAKIGVAPEDWVECSSAYCGARSKFGYGEDVIRKWNRRAEEPNERAVALLRNYLGILREVTANGGGWVSGEAVIKEIESIVAQPTQPKTEQITDRDKSCVHWESCGLEFCQGDACHYYMTGKAQPEQATCKVCGKPSLYQVHGLDGELAGMYCGGCFHGEAQPEQQPTRGQDIPNA